MRLARWGLAAALGVVGCGDVEPSGPDFGGSTAGGTAAESDGGGERGSTPGGGDDGADDGSGEGSSDDDDDDDDDAKFDLGGGDPIDDGGSDGGCAKIDFLFVIDDSGSMGTSQSALVASFPGFVDAIQETVNGQDHNIMVVTSSSLESRGKGGWYCACQDEECCAQHCEVGWVNECQPGSCGGPACAPSTEPCRATYGAGKTRYPAEGNVGATSCGIADGKRYITDQQPALESTFGCMASTSTFGTEENNVTVLLEALSPEMTGAGGCNEGFLRDDAILVITILSDASVTASEQANGDPQQWYESIVATKGGNEEAIVMIGLFNDAADEGSPCYNLGPADKLFDLVDLFGPRGFSASICQESYDELFTEAVAGIDATCDAFEPEG